MPHCQRRPQAISELELQFRAVESAFAWLHPTTQPGASRGGLERALGTVPDFVRAGALFGPGREVDPDVAEAERAVEVVQRATEHRHFTLDLGFWQEHVSVVLSELAQAQQTVQHATRLVAMHDTELGQSQWQIAIGQGALLHDLRVARAIHGLHRRALAFIREGEHVLPKVLPVPALFPNSAANQLRGLHLFEAGCQRPSAHCGLQGAVHREPARGAKTPCRAPLPASGRGPFVVRGLDDPILHPVGGHELRRA